MWVYSQNSSTEPRAKHLKQPAQTEWAKFSMENTAPIDNKPLPKPMLKEMYSSRHKQKMHVQRSVLCYGLGLFTSGVILSLISKELSAYFTFYGKGWLSLFAEAGLLRMFCILFLSGILLLTAALFLGFCPFGKPLAGILLFTYGIGSGFLFLQIFKMMGWNGVVFHLMVPGIYISVLGWSLCSLSGYAGRMSKKLLGTMNGKSDPSAARTSAKALVDRYFLLSAAQVPVCAVIAAVASGFFRVS